MTITWKKSYEIGDSEIDGQHKYLFTLARILNTKKDKESIVLSFMHLYKHLRLHFKYEENLMKGAKYPHYFEHYEKHSSILKNLDSLSHKVGSNTFDKGEISSFMLHLQLEHIAIEDAKLVNLLK